MLVSLIKYTVLLILGLIVVADPCKGSQIIDPDILVPASLSIREACEILLSRKAERITAEELYMPKIMALAESVRLGAISESEFVNRSSKWQSSLKNLRQRETAALIGILRAQGHQDWEMYSRYDVDGIADLWDANVIAGDRVSNHKDHPHYKYTYGSFWFVEVYKACKNFE